MKTRLRKASPHPGPAVGMSSSLWAGWVGGAPFVGVTRRALRHKGHAARVVTAAYERLRVLPITHGLATQHTPTLTHPSPLKRIYNLMKEACRLIR
ncbi:hypothetical protein E2C01_091030 [Portunus trituberculatus]|uniref:Uncharacterized protein n=1 Tax=Portunus trituberculatus TaxID=210409 RepID=A0A5B7JMZ2_PORTR|nr:hypothetical protein [Portunus trituberculatus]